MADRYLIDTGFIVALLDRKDPDHSACSDAWRSIRGQFFTVEGTMVEAAHLLNNDPGACARAIALLRRVSTLVVAPSTARADRALELMKKYRDVPMDYVDADLVALAEEEELDEILTVDIRGFSAYRIAGKKAFTILPPPT